jgi:hypothetical protein
MVGPGVAAGSEPCRYVAMSLCRYVAMSLPLCRYVAMSLCRYVAMSLFAMSLCRYVAMSLLFYKGIIMESFIFILNHIYL